MALQAFFVDDIEKLFANFAGLEYLDEVLQGDLELGLFFLGFAPVVQWVEKLLSKSRVWGQAQLDQGLDNLRGFECAWAIIVPWDEQVLREFYIFAVRLFLFVH